jgi:hypothetical protein
MEAEFSKALHQFVKGRTNVPIALAKVTKVGVDTIDVVTVNDDEIFEVRLQSIVDGNTEGVLLKPKLKSWVVVADIGSTEHDYIVVATEQLDSMTIKIGTTSFEMTDQGVSIARNGQDLKAVLLSLTDFIKAIKVIAPNGITSSLLPLQLPNLLLIEEDLKQIFK